MLKFTTHAPFLPFYFFTFIIYFFLITLVFPLSFCISSSSFTYPLFLLSFMFFPSKWLWLIFFSFHLGGILGWVDASKACIDVFSQRLPWSYVLELKAYIASLFTIKSCLGRFYLYSFMSPKDSYLVDEQNSFQKDDRNIWFCRENHGADQWQSETSRTQVKIYHENGWFKKINTSDITAHSLP